jgi:hypothetical protein
MIIIREEQLERLERDQHEELIARLCTFARRNLDRLTTHLDDAALRQRIEEDVAAATSFGIESPRGYLHFVMIALLRDQPRIYQYNLFADALRKAGPDVERSLAVFLERLMGELDAAVARGEN